MYVLDVPSLNAKIDRSYGIQVTLDDGGDCMSALFRLWFLLVAVCGIGCVDHRPWRTMHQPHAPWVGPQSRAEFQERISAFYIPFLPIPPAGWWEYRYMDPSESEVFDPVEVGRRAEAFLRRNAQFEVQLEPSYRDNPRFVAQFERWREGTKPDFDIPLVTPFRMTLVCLDPVVVFRTEEMSTYQAHPFLMLIAPDPDHHSPDDAGSVNDAEFLTHDQPVLPGGVIPRTRLKATRHVEWFSPTLEKGLTPLKFDANARAEIAVPWGRLLVSWDGERLEVQAER